MASGNVPRDMASAAIVRSGLASETILLYQLHGIAAVTAVGYGSIVSNGYLPDTVHARRLAVQLSEASALVSLAGRRRRHHR